ncbi:SDR family NAD(P)-dependent oxidoreductase [Pseudoduganella ginsengisoli]|uniref:SDR family oxidoreductase n=1 Tax=Pseudoduganella ginsengisoli TaxID=1462440 RepID=A0A6L6PY36_9BURK|nr:SDR family oxidoreductase [Pseudoduganella ginsengisoli]MTW01612.1 SDR family oxidoreductase [Pseudoduganella ginsengisoli]
MQPSSPTSAVIVTGGASGIGLACAQALAQAGRPVALWDINAGAATELAAKIARDYTVNAIGVGIDLSDADALPAALDATRAALPAIGGLVHAAGMVDMGSIDGLTPDNWDKVMNVNLRSLALLVRALHGDFKANPGAAIAGIASINATLGNAVNPIYSASKGGMLSLVRALADALGRDGIRINCISPGQILTPMIKPVVDHLPPGAFERRILLSRLGRPEEVGKVARFLLSDEASYITAAEIVVDGGNLSSQRM